MLHNFSKILKKYFSAIDRIQFDIWYVLKTRVGFKIEKLQSFKTILAAIHLLFEIVINMKILENSQEYIYSEVIYL